MVPARPRSSRPAQAMTLMVPVGDGKGQALWECTWGQRTGDRGCSCAMDQDPMPQTSPACATHDPGHAMAQACRGSSPLSLVEAAAVSSTVRAI